MLDAGDADGGWDYLREATMIMQAALDILAAYLAGEPLEPLTESLAFDKWGVPLINALELACESVMGDRASGSFPVL